MENSSSQVNENPTSLVGYRLAAERDARKLSQAGMAALAGVSREQWGKYERGQAVPGADTLAMLLRAGIDLHMVLTGEPAPSFPMSEDERALVCQFRQADEHIKSAARAMLNLPAVAPVAGAGVHIRADNIGNVSNAPIGTIVQNF